MAGHARFDLFTGECTELLQKHIADQSIDLTVTSPPYDDLREYNGYVFDFPAIAKQLHRVTKPGGVVVWQWRMQPRTAMKACQRSGKRSVSRK